jgi:isopropylmalate/homocitrate/citramalate synthase
MSSQPWKRDAWFSSPWNFQPEVVSGFKPPSRVQVHDVTLRDGEQQAGVEFTADEKVRIGVALAEAGVARIEAGLPAVSPADAEAVRRLAGMGLPAQIVAFSRCMVDDVKRALDTGVKGVVMEIPSSDHIVEYAYRWKMDRAVALSIESTRFAHENGLSVSFFPIDATRADILTFLQLVERVAKEGHMDALGLVDTFGVLSPHAVDFLVRKVRERIDKPLETHFHMDFGLGVANTVMAVAAGVETIQTTVSGIGERAGNTPMEETVMALLTMYGIDAGVRTEHLTPLARLVAELSGVQQPSNRPVTGSRLFNVESGIIATWVRNVGQPHLTEAFPYRPELVGQPPPEIVLGKGSGVDNVVVWLDRLGVRATDEQTLAILQEVKAKSLEKKRLLDPEEFVRIVERVVGPVPAGRT